VTVLTGGNSGDVATCCKFEKNPLESIFHIHQKVQPIVVEKMLPFGSLVRFKPITNSP
jgi:hypothetical protein